MASMVNSYLLVILNAIEMGRQAHRQPHIARLPLPLPRRQRRPLQPHYSLDSITQPRNNSKGASTGNNSSGNQKHISEYVSNG